MAVANESYAPSVLVSTEGLPEKDWLEYRRRGIGGSDAAAILGISPFATARDLYYDKLKIVPFDDSESNWVPRNVLLPSASRVFAICDEEYPDRYM